MNLTKLKELEAKATPGGWNHMGMDDGSYEITDGYGFLATTREPVEGTAGDNAALIVAMRNTLPDLIDIAERAQTLAIWLDDYGPENLLRGDGNPAHMLRSALAKLELMP